MYVVVTHLIVMYLNVRWKSATSVVQHPKDWSDELAAETLARESWRDGNWWKLLYVSTL